MADRSRLDDLRRRVEHDPASIAFAQLAEEYRRAGALAEAIETCRKGLARHPGYHSARVTLGRALVELGNLEEGKRELEAVLVHAPENLAALRGVADVCRRQGAFTEALAHYRSSLAIARSDPDLARMVAELTIAAEAPAPPDLQAREIRSNDLDEPDGANLQSQPDRRGTMSAGSPAERTIASLEQWLAAIHALRTDRDA